MPPDDVSFIRRILSKTKQIENQIIVIKLSEIIISDKLLLTNFSENINILHAIGATIFIVHEYNKIVEEELKELSDTLARKYSQFCQNKRAKMIEMIISGRINRDIIESLCSYAVPAIGLSGKDNLSMVANTFPLKTNPFKDVSLLINSEFLLSNSENKYVSVISPIACNERGNTIILDTYLTASMIASSIGADHFIMLEDESYLTRNNITLNNLNELNDVLNGTNELENNLPEINAAKYAIKHAGCLVHFLNAQIKDVLLLKLLV